MPVSAVYAKGGPFVRLLDNYISVFEEIKKNMFPAEFEAMISGTSNEQALVSLDIYSRSNFFWAFKDPRTRLEAKNLINTSSKTGKRVIGNPMILSNRFAGIIAGPECKLGNTRYPNS